MSMISNTAFEPNVASLNPVLQYQNEPVVMRIADELGVDVLRARGIFDDTKRFLFLATAGQKGLRPTKVIDEGWHAFVLHTKDYAEFCKQFLGRFIHHQPDTIGMKSEAKTEGFDETLRLAKSVFGDDLGRNWTGRMGDCQCQAEISDCSPDSNCESAPSDCALN